MAHHSATLKAIRQTPKRTERNRERMARVGTYIKKVEEAVAKGDVKLAQSAFREAQKEILRASTRKVLKANNAARRISRLNSKVKAIAAK